MLKDNDRLPPSSITIDTLSSAHYRRLNIGIYKDADIACVNDEAQLKLEKYLSKARWAIKSGIGLYFYGPNSTGKTYAACALLKQLARLGYSCLLVRADDVKNYSLETKAMFDKRETWYARMRNVHVLLIDDIGKEYRSKNTDYMQRVLGLLLMERQQRPYAVTLFTSNVTPKKSSKHSISDFELIYGKSTSELLLDITRPVEIKGVNYRNIKQEEFKDELGF